MSQKSIHSKMKITILITFFFFVSNVGGYIFSPRNITLPNNEYITVNWSFPGKKFTVMPKDFQDFPKLPEFRFVKN